ncbi:MAG TPA: hypothetical protein VFV25_12375 [Methylibium sp.]
MSRRRIHRFCTLSFTLSVGTLGGALLLALPAITHAQRPPVEISTQTGLPRHDVHAVCPGIDQSLQQSLDYAWQRVRQPGLVSMQFRLKGQQITEVTPTGGTFDYFRYVRRAVGKLACNSDSDDEQLFAFDVRFVEVYADSGAPAMALRIEEPESMVERVASH